MLYGDLEARAAYLVGHLLHVMSTAWAPAVPHTSQALMIRLLRIFKTSEAAVDTTVVHTSRLTTAANAFRKSPNNVRSGHVGSCKQPPTATCLQRGPIEGLEQNVSAWTQQLRVPTSGTQGSVGSFGLETVRATIRHRLHHAW